MVKDFEIIGEITNTETIAVGSSIRISKRLKKIYGDGRWHKLKGIAKLSLLDGTICRVEIHWYEMSLQSLSDAINLILEDWREDALRGVPSDAVREIIFVSYTG